MRHFEIEFEEMFIPFEMETGNAHYEAFSPTGQVPFLEDGDIMAWDSLAIMETLAEKFPQKHLWPEDPKLRAIARSLSASMHAGFVELRKACPMNMRKSAPEFVVGPLVQSDIDRIHALWTMAIKQSGGPFLAGDFSIVDAMFAPVISRFQTYHLSDDPIYQAYRDVMIALPAWEAWEKAALEERWRIDRFEK